MGTAFRFDEPRRGKNCQHSISRQSFGRQNHDTHMQQLATFQGGGLFDKARTLFSKNDSISFFFLNDLLSSC